jgi:hypothetical protein
MIIVEPDVELIMTGIIRVFLAGRGEEYAQGVIVDRRTQNPIPSRHVTVRDDGGPRIDLTRWQVRAGFNVYAGTDQDAADLARLVSAGVWAAADEGKPLRKVIRPTSPVRIPEPDDRPHLYWSAELIIRGGEV